jgi:hypothetical protein
MMATSSIASLIPQDVLGRMTPIVNAATTYSVKSGDNDWRQQRLDHIN